MSPTLRGSGAAAAVVALCGLAACSPDAEIVRPPAPVGGTLFERYVAIGNSLTAGFQSAGINAETQAQAYPVLLARAVGTSFRVPSLALPGCPPPIVDFQTLERLGGVGGGSCTLRDPGSITDRINNVAVFGATSLDPTSRSTAQSNPTTLLILGGRSQVERALEANPTFVSVWIGSNDLLDAALTGVLVATPGVSRGITSQQTFETRYAAMLAQLQAGAELEGGVLIGALNPGDASLLIRAATLVTDPAFKAEFDRLAQQPTTLRASCTASTESLISLLIIEDIRNGTHPPEIGCEPEPAPLAPVGDLHVVDAAEQQTIAMAVADYNAYIAARALALGFAYLDPNVVLASLRQSGQIPGVPDLTSATAPFGQYVSLDGVHPSAKGQAVVANAVIAAINEEYGLSIPDVPIP
jgi:lysophospholipase L1-like esterase